MFDKSGISNPSGKSLSAKTSVSTGISTGFSSKMSSGTVSVIFSTGFSAFSATSEFCGGS